MSVAGILASSLFANSGSHNSTPTNPQPTAFGSQLSNSFQSYLKAGNVAGAQSIYSAMQQKLAAFGSSTGPVSTQMSQLGQDLNSGNLNLAQNDFVNLQSTLQQGLTARLHHVAQPSGVGSAPATSGQTGDPALSNPMSAALRAYSSLQYPAGSALLANPSTFSVNA